MKKVKQLIFTLLIFCCTLIVKAEDTIEGPFYFDWNNELIGADLAGDIEFSDNIGYQEGVVTIKSIYRSNVYTSIERYDKDGKLLHDNILDGTWFYSMISDQKYVYAIISNDNSTDSSNENMPYTSLKDGGIKLIKLNEKMEIVDEIIFEEVTEPGTDGMINARRFGHDILSFDKDNIYVYCGEEYMLKTTKEFGSWEVLEYTPELSATHFPDLTKEYEILNEWMQEVNNGNYLIDYLVTTHMYKDYYLTSGMKYTTTERPLAIFKLYNNDGKLILEKTNENYSKFIQGRVIKNYIVLIGLIWDENFNTTSSDILVYDMKGNLLQKISSGNIYHMLNETESGFVVTNIENSCSTSPGIEITGITDVRQSSKTEYCDNYNNEVYYLQLNITTKVEGKGNIEVVKTSKTGDEITFKVTPEEGYVLGMINVTDENGNIVTFTDYTFTMPSANVTIEAVFVPENPDTADIAIIAIISVVILGSIGIIYSIKKLSWLK